MKRAAALLGLALIGAAAWYVYQARNAPPEVSLVTPKRERLVSAVATNGKVEPLEWTVVRAAYLAICVALTALAAVSFIGQARERPWRGWAQVAMWGALVGLGALYSSTRS